MISYSTYKGTVVIEHDEPHEEATPERAEAMATALLEAASDARRRVSCTEPRMAEGAPVLGVTAKSSTCVCGEGIYLAPGIATSWIHSRDLGR